jgi:hypothetical protein
MKIGTEQGLGGEDALRVADRHPTQRGTGGKPVWYQTAISEATSTTRSPPPYHSATVMGLPG